MPDATPTAPQSSPADRVSVARGLGAYALVLAAALVALGLLLEGHEWRRPRSLSEAGAALAATSPAVKLLVFGIYLSLCCTFLPLPTGWIVAAVATRQAAVAAGFFVHPAAQAFATAGLVGLVGAAGSTLANLNDYHLFTWLLRSRRISAVRATRTHERAARWFARSPFFFLVVFNIIPIPVDVIRMLATSCRYPRLPFAAANLVGRFVRYGVIALVTYAYNLGWVAVAALLAVAVVLGLGRALSHVLRRNAPAEKPR